MEPPWGLLWLLLAAASCLLEGKRSSVPHGIRVTYSSATEDCPGLPFFSAEGYVDDQLIIRYESHTKKMHPWVDWLNTLEKEEPKFYQRYLSILRNDQEDFQENVHMLQKLYNQSGGYHIVQMIITCEVWEDGTKSGRWQYGYDGRHFLKYDMGTSTWYTADKIALGIKLEWENETDFMHRFTGFLESTCPDWLEKNDHYGSNSSLRKEPPMVKMSSRTEPEDGMEIHICEPYGFYPREIDAFWMRDGEVWLQDTFHKSVAPNADGTYHYWLSIRIDPKERDRYRCHVEHDGLPEPLDLALKVPQSRSNLWYIIGGVVAGVIVVCAIVGIRIFLKFKKGVDEQRNDPCTSSLMTNC
ncbi:class I histocompatibility antigen, F10 alpha chain-like isoform X1 [Erythrolamprus reginae]|uniref:class I histocompatibility antigen, F10 alpha chain-like isoform X1 n=1 Tax=Erythrolamprus reginae TaxID=121349 RepID=UPI00396C452D